MTSSETSRVRRAPWVDVRFLLGIVLIVASIAGVWFVVSAARQTAPMIAAARTLTPGEVITATDVRVVDVALGTLDEAYLAPDELTIGAIATRTVNAGELVPGPIQDQKRTRGVGVRELLGRHPSNDRLSAATT